jgi:drug/metabolite transporter (DMT)-like permease
VLPAAAAPPAHSVARATLFVLVAACCFGSISILTAVAASGGSSLLNTMAWRYSIGALLLAVVMGPARMRVPAARGWRLVLLGGAGQALVSFLGLLPLTRYQLPAATLAFLFYTFPAWVALFAAARGTERIGRTRAVALAVSLAGIVFLVGDPWAAALSPAGVAIALLAAVVYALYIPLLGALRGELPPAVASAYVAAGAGAIYLVAAAVTGTLTTAVTPGAWAAILTLAVVAIGVAFILFLNGLAVLGPVRAAIVSTAEPFFTAALAALVLAQPLTARTAVGGALIAAAVVLLQRGR